MLRGSRSRTRAPGTASTPFGLAQLPG